MKSIVKQYIIVLTSLCTIIGAYANTPNSKNTLVNIAKEQRILSQKIAKSYLLLAYGANLKEIKKEYTTSITRFEKNLNILKVQTPYFFSNVASATIARETIIWYKFKSQIDGTPSISNLDGVIDFSNRLLKKSHLAFIALKTEYEHNNLNYNRDDKLNNLLKISQKQEILSERLCLYFVAQKINITRTEQNPRILGNLRIIVERIDEQLSMLLQTTANNNETEKIIKDTLIVFDDIRTNKSDFLNGKSSMNKIYKTANELKKLFRILTSKYTELASI